MALEDSDSRTNAESDVFSFAQNEELPSLEGDVFEPDVSPSIAPKQIEAKFPAAFSMKEDFSVRYADLMRRGRANDLEAISELGESLWRCSRYFDALARAEQNVQQLSNPLNPDQRARLETESTNFLDAPVTSKLQSACSGISTDQAERYLDWLQRGAEFGDSLMAFNYVQYPIVSGQLQKWVYDPQALLRYRANSERFMFNLARQCYPSAFVNLADAYETGLYV